MRYGVYDTQDECWLGDDAGPRLFEDFTLARIAAQVFSDQLYGTDLIERLVAKEYDEAPKRLRDEITTRRSTLKSLQRIEGRAERGQ